MRGRRLLVLLGLLFVGGFWFQRLNSDFLRIEQDEPLAQAVAADSGLSLPEVMALRGLCESQGLPAPLEQVARSLVANRLLYGRDELAVLATLGHRQLVDELLRSEAGDADATASALATRPEAILAVRFEKDAERYASRR